MRKNRAPSSPPPAPSRIPPANHPFASLSWPEQRLKSWLGSAAVLLREHLQDQHREGSVVFEGNRCELNRGCERANCAAASAACPGAEAAAAGEAVEPGEANGSARGVQGGAHGTGASGDGEEGFAVGEESTVEKLREAAPRGGGRRSGKGGQGMGQACVPTAEEEGLPLPAAMTLRFLAAMDEGYVGSMREENARSRRRREEEGAG